MKIYKPKFLRRFLIFTFVILLNPYIRAQDKEKKYNIVFLFADDLGCPDLGSYGNKIVKTPHLDSLAQTSVLFKRAYVASPQCSPSRASILTGRSPHSIGATRLHVDAQKEFKSIIEMLKENGYYTGAYRKVHQSLIEAQFDFKGDKDLEAFFKQRPDNKPFFLWFGSTDPHRPYPGTNGYQHDPKKVTVPDYLPDTKAVREDLANYYNEIARFDDECGQILGYINKYKISENTIIVVAGDNGKPFPRAKATLYEAGTNVPLIIKWPGKTKGETTSTELVSLMDLAPTWLEAAGIPVPQNMEGISLRTTLEGKTAKIRDYIFSERNWHDNWDPMRSVTGKRYKLIQNFRPEVGYLNTLDRLYSPTWTEFENLQKKGELSKKLQWYFKTSKPEIEFYDLENDPGEWNNLAALPEFQSLVKQYQEILGQWMNKTNDFLPAPRMSFPKRSKLNEQYEPLNAEEIKKD